MHNLRQGVYDRLFTDGIINVLVSEFLKSATLFAGVLVLIFIGYKVMLYMADINSKLDPFVIVRPVLILGSLVLYTQLVNMLVFQPVAIVDQIVVDGLKVALADDWSSSGGDTAIFLGSVTAGYLTVAKFVPSAAMSGATGLFSILAISQFLEVLHLILVFAATAVGAYMLIRQVFLIAIYYVLGVFAIPFSLIVGNQAVLGNWFFGFVSVMLWLPIINLLMGIIRSLDGTGPLGLSLLNFGDALYGMAMQIAFISLILQVPKFANILVSKGAEATQGGGVIAAAAGGAAGAS